MPRRSFRRTFRAQHPEFPKLRDQTRAGQPDARRCVYRLLPGHSAVQRRRSAGTKSLAPVLIVTSNEGMAYAESLRMHELLPKAQLWAPPDVGHSPHVEIPEEFNRRVLEFLQVM